ncbi:transfer protein [Streptomyces rubrogriseus]|uniref:Transfer protein n=1 Tax=Streptomyces rubrogriseus TaxID=194673 RepID=A0A6G3TU20_9ACTN|nr:transfer protein [Streptomyces rubrogriseus]NEC40134.1 transfer protein [Streptomyces rubrogriseus]
MSIATTTPAIPDDQVVELMVQVPPGQVIKYDLAALASAFEITDPGRIAVETDGSRTALVTIYPSNPLAVMPPPTEADMTMDAYGRIVVGRYHNGRPARRKLFDPRTGSAVRALTFGTTGAGKSRTVQYVLACEKRNGIVSWYGDLKGGQSAPEAKGQVDWLATSQEEVILMLRAAVAVAQARQARYAALGRNAFVIGNPDPLLSVRIDEANRLLEKGAPYREEATYLVKELGRTGRSVGVGEELDAQAGHLEELGGSDTLRAMLKEGEVTLLRWSSSMMRQLVADGLLPAGTQLMPIPKSLKPKVLRSQFAAGAGDDDDDACDTQGTAYLLSGPNPASMMRHFRIGSILPMPGLDPEILALYGPGDPARLEDTSLEAAGEPYAARGTDDMAVLCAAVRDEQQKQVAKAQAGNGGRGAKLLEDRIRIVLADAEDPLTPDEITVLVNADGGAAVRVGSVRNRLGMLADAGDVTRAGRGLYEIAR